MPQRIVAGDRAFTVDRLEERASFRVVATQPARPVEILPGLSVERGAVTARLEIPEIGMGPTNMQRAIQYGGLQRVAHWLDGDDRALALDMALWRANE